MEKGDGIQFMKSCFSSTTRESSAIVIMTKCCYFNFLSNLHKVFTIVGLIDLRKCLLCFTRILLFFTTTLKLIFESVILMTFGMMTVIERKHFMFQ